MKPAFPCTKDCPRRTAHCHDRAVCPDWGKYEDAYKAEREAAAAATQTKWDFSDVRRGALRKSSERKRIYERQKDLARRAEDP